MSEHSELIAFRRHLHAHPEISGNESHTAKLIVEYVSKFQPSKIIENVGGFGVLVIFDSGKKGKTILFRAELDALPIQEINNFKHRSKHKNTAHKCGHDGHSSILLGLAKQIHEQPFSKGKVVLLFQPSEEDGTGAKAVLADPKYEGIDPDYVFALHNLPGFPKHQIVLRDKAFTAAVISMTVTLSGKTAHAAEPEHGINPALAMASILSEAVALSNNDINQTDFCVVTPIHMSLGSIDFGISAGYGELRFTLRTWSEDELHILIQKIQTIIKTEAEKHQLKAETELSHHFAANQNHLDAVRLIKDTAEASKMGVILRKYPFKWGEDFGLFTQKYKGAMLGLGAGTDTPALHNPDYDFPDDIMPTGIELFYNIVSKILN